LFQWPRTVVRYRNLPARQRQDSCRWVSV